MGHTNMAYPQPSQDDFFSMPGSIREERENGRMFELGKAVVGEEVMSSCSPLVGNELAYVTSKVCGSWAKTGVIRGCHLSTTSSPVKSTCFLLRH